MNLEVRCWRNATLSRAEFSRATEAQQLVTQLPTVRPSPLQSKDHGQLSTSPRGSHSLCTRPGTDPGTNANLCSLSLSNQPTTFTDFFFFFFSRPTYIGKAAVTSSFWGHYTYSCLAGLLSELHPWTRQHHQACFHKKSKRKSQRHSCPSGLSTTGNLRSFRTRLFRQPAKR